MNKTELVNKISEVTELSKKDVSVAVEATLESITEALANGEKVSLIGFGTLEAKPTAERKGRNPQDGSEITIAAGKRVSFKPSGKLKEIVNV